MLRISVLIALSLPLIPTQAGVPVAAGSGTAYGTRDSRVCPSSKEPLKGGPSAAQAKEYVICSQEHVFGDSLWLVDNVQVQVAATSRPFNLGTDSFDNIDPTQPVYNIRGSFTQYQCGRLGLVSLLGKNCNIHPHPNASGKCYKDTFGDWHCDMQDLVSGSDYHLTRAKQPPPK